MVSYSPTTQKRGLYTIQILLLAGVYFASGLASFSVAVSHTIVTPVVFAAEGFSLAAVILLGARVWPGVFLGQLALGLYNGLAWELALGVAVINSLEAVLGQALFRRFALHASLERVRDVTGLLMLIFLVLQPFSATLGNMLLWLGGVVSTANLYGSWFSWWFGNVIGQILFAPLLLNLWTNKPDHTLPLQKSLWLGIIIIPMGIFVCSTISSNSNSIVFTLIIPLLVLLADKGGGMVTVNIASAIVAIVALFFAKFEMMKGNAAVDDRLLLDLDSHLLGMALTGQFISALLSEHKLAQASGQEALERLKKIADRVPGMVYQFRLNPDGSSCFPYASPAIKDIYHVSPEKVQHDASRVFAVLHPEDFNAIADAIKESATHLSPWHQEYRVRFEDGSEHWLLGNALPQREPDGAVLWHGFITDITARKLLEAQLLKSHEELLCYFEQPFIGMLTANTNKRTININQRFCDIVGYTKEEMLDINWEKLTYPADIALSQSQFERAIRGEIDSYKIEMRYIHKSFRIVFVELAVMVVRNAQGQPDYFICMAMDITESILAKQRLERSEAQFRSTFEYAPIGVMNVSLNGYFMAVNQTFCDFVGYSREELLKMSVMAVTQDKDQAEHALYIEKLAKGELENFYLEKQYVRKDRSLIWGYLSVKLSCYPDGTPDYFVVIVENIEERKRIQSEILAAKNQLQATLNAIPDLLFEVDAEGRYHDYHSPHTDLLAVPPEQMLGRKLSDVMPPDSAEVALLALQEAGQQGWSAGKQFKLTLPDGEHWFELSVAIKPTHNRLQPHFIVLSRDITARKQMEETIRENEAKLNTILENVEASIYIKDPDYCYQYANRQMREHLGLTLEEIIGKTDADLFDDATAKLLQSNDRRVLEFGERIAVEEHSTTRYASHTAVVFSVKQPLYHADGSLYGLCGISTDITERKRMEEAIRASEAFTISILDSLTAHIAVLNENGVIVMVNRAWQDFAEHNGLPSRCQMMMRTNYLDVCAKAIGQANSEEAAEILEGIKAVLRGDTPYFYDEYPCHSAHEHRWFRMSASQLKGNMRGVVVSHENITQRKLMEDALRASEARFRSIINLSPIPLALNDAQQNITFLNPAFVQTFGYEVSDIPTLSVWWPTAYPDAAYRQWVADTWQKHIEEAEREHKPFRPIELSIRCKDGNQKTALVSAAAIADSFSEEHVVMLVDITERIEAETELRIAATVFNAQEGMMITDANETILKVNQAFSDITGYSHAEVAGQTPRFLRSGKHGPEFFAALWRCVQDTGSWQGEIWNKRKNGEIFPEWLTITAVKNKHGTVTHHVATLTDITERKATEEYIHHLAFYDPLTQLPNRRLLQERLKHGFEVSRRTGHQMAVLMMDLDKFKAVNDSLGHAAGDELLKQVADRIKQRLREVDLVARLGGDEFVVLIENVSQVERVARVAEDIIQTLSQPFMLGQHHEAHIGVSIGVSLYPRHGSTVETLMDNADAALYHAKDQGRGCFAYFSEKLTKKARERIASELRLRKAIDRDQLCVYFQPQIDIVTSQIIGAEALVRWHDPAQGRLLPREFITLAEETGLILPIGEWVLKETCKLGQQWLAQGYPPITLAVNVSPYQFRHADMTSLMASILQETGFPAQYLELEITETGLTSNQEHAVDILRNLHGLGIRLAIDNFGSGYSSLAYLKLFPVDLLKIDKTFIADLPRSEQDKAITQTIISMAHHLGLKVLAEGVETAEQLAYLKQQGCDRYQGYLYNEPLSAEQFTKLLAKIKR